MLRHIILCDSSFGKKILSDLLLFRRQRVRYCCNGPALRTVTTDAVESHLTKEEEKEILQNQDESIIDFDMPSHILIPQYPKRHYEPLETRKHRLMYQSRKRGMLENDLILATFAGKYLHSMSPELTSQYDELINGVSNEWDIFNWATGSKPTPPEYDNEIMMMLKEHVKNTACEKRLRIPKLDYDDLLKKQEQH